MIVAAQPKVSFSYTADTGEFIVAVTETKKVSYTIEYDWQNVDATGAATTSTDALTNTKEADASNKVSDTQVAGTVSSNDTFIHQVLRGVLNVTADTLDGKVLNYQQVFKITEDKKIKMLTEQSSTKLATQSSVLGATTTATESAITQPTMAKTAGAKELNQEIAVDQNSAPGIPLLPLALGGTTIGVAVIGIALWHRHTKRDTIKKLTDIPSSTGVNL